MLAARHNVDKTHKINRQINPFSNLDVAILVTNVAIQRETAGKAASTCHYGW